MRIIGGENAVKKALVIVGLMLGVGLLTGGTVKAACNSYFTNIFGYNVREWCTPPADTGGHCNLGEKSCSKNSVSESVYKFTCSGHSKRNGISECGNGMPGAEPNTGETMSVGDPGCNKTIQIDVYNKECWVAGQWTCNGASVALGGNMLDFFVYYSNDCPPPACNTGSVVMSVSPNPVSADNQDVHFKITSGDASLWIGNSWTGGVANCDESDWNDVVCKSATAGNFSWTHTWKLCRADDTDICSPECKNSVKYRVSPRILNPKKCSVSVGATFSVGQPIAISADGWGNMGVGKSEPVRLWLERADGKAINPLPTGVGDAYVSPQTGNIAYRMGECLSANDQLCDLSKNISGGLAPGAYFVHCDLPTDLVPTPPVGLGSKCSGNPFCQLGLTPPRAAGDARATVTKRETACDSWVYCNAISRQDRDYFTVAEPKPVGVGITIRNSGNTIVPVETGNKNQICQTVFKSAGVHDRKVKFSVTVSDASGGETINKVSLRLTRGAAVKMQVNGIGLTTTTPTYSVTGGGASLYDTVTKSVSGDKLTVTFPILFPTTFAGLAGDSLQIWAEDETKQNSGWTDGDREFKVWDCKVPVSGSVFDGSDAPLGRPVCPADGFSALVEADIFKSLTYVNPVSGSKIMTIMGASNYAGSGDKSLIWGGGDYAAKFNGEEELPGSAPIARLGDKKKSPVPYTCPVTVAAISISQTEIDAYQDGPEATVDFSFTANQEPWYQTVSGGRLGAGEIQSMVPPTCNVVSLCTPALSIESVSGTNGVVIAGGVIKNMTGCGDDCKNGIPNDWYRKNKNITDGSINYEGLKTLYYDRKGIGKVVGGGNWSLVKSEAGANKVIFVNSDLTINADNTVSTGVFLMVVVKGNVTFNSDVKRFDGIIVTDKVVKAIGENTETLDLNGSIYARGGFVNGRSLEPEGANNEAPSVKVNYRPDFIFSMPAKLAENVYNWREGN